MNDSDLLDALKRSMAALKQVKQHARELEDAAHEPIAIVGMGCRFAGGATTPEAFWDLLDRGVDAIAEVPSLRWDANSLYDPDPAAAGKAVCRSGGFLRDDVHAFDATFFGIAPREARSMDPQQRLLLEVAWEALENAGILPEPLMASSTGVFVATNFQEYAAPQRDLDQLDGYVLTGAHPSVASGRISYVLGLKGPSLTVDTACSSSLVAVHLACQSLRAGESSAALAGGVGLLLAPTLHVEFSRLRGIAPDGRCKTFDAAADGMGWGEGCGVVVLKRLTDAQRDGDEILAVIRGSAVNQDGRSNGLTAPNGPSQEAVIASALERARVSPRDVGYVETHGAGTPLGDPVEVQALGAALGRGRAHDAPVLIGSVKTNIGHTMAAAGVAGLIKTVLALRNDRIPRSLHFATPSPHIAWSELPVKVTSDSVAWPRRLGAKRIAGVSSFGVSGTNAHVILEEAPERVVPSADRASMTLPSALSVERAASEPIGEATIAAASSARGAHLLVVSTKTADALPLAADRYAEHVARRPDLELASLCHAAATTRTHFEERLAVVATSAAEAAERLRAWAQGDTAPGCLAGTARAGRPPRVAFLFTGQGSQYVGMGRDLYTAEPVFRAALDRCAEILAPLLERPLLSVLYPDTGASNAASHSALDETRYTQPALFAVEYAICELWRSWGVVPVAMMGHSVGEYVAACVAGVFGLEDGLALIAARGRLMQELPPDGEMASLKMDAASVERLLARWSGEIVIGAYNGPESVVVSGRREAVRALCEELTRQGVKTKRLNISIASHSPQMDPMLDAFEDVARKIRMSTPSATLITNLTGAIAGAEVATPEHWRRHVREAVRFAQGMEAIRALGVDAFVEVGPESTLLGMGALCLNGEPYAWLPSLKKDQSSHAVLFESLGRLHVDGYPVDFTSVADARTKAEPRAPLPTYAFQRQSYTTQQAPSAVTPRIGVVERTTRLSGTAIDLPGEALHRVVRLNGESTSYLRDHKVHGVVAVSAAVYIAMLLTVAADALAASAVTLRDVQVVRPLVLDDDTSLHVVLEPNGDGSFAFRLCTAESTVAAASKRWLDHARGTIKVGATEARVARIQQARVPARGQARAEQRVFDRLARMQIEMGPAWRCVEDVFPADESGTAVVRVARDGAAEAPIHPALLDNAIAASVISLTESDRGAPTIGGVPHLLWSIEELRWYGEATARALCRAVRKASGAETLTVDFVLEDEAGRVLLEADGVAFKRAEPSMFASLARAREAAAAYALDWIASGRLRASSTAEPKQQRLSGRWFVVSNDARHAREVAHEIGAIGAGKAGSVDAALHDAHREAPLDGVLCWWTGTADDDDRARAAHAHALEAIALVKALAPEVATPLARNATALSSEVATPLARNATALASEVATPLARDATALAPEVATRQAPDATPLARNATPRAPEVAMPRLVWVTDGAMHIAQDDKLVPELSAIWGLGRVLQQERPELGCTLVDVKPGADAKSVLQMVLAAGQDENQFALRGTDRYVPRLVRAPRSTTRARALRPDGTVLVTGGLGALGLRIAEWLVESHGCRSLVLAGRRAPAPDRLARIEALRTRGVDVRVVSADVSDAEEARALVANISQHRSLSAVFHAAGIAEHAHVTELDDASFARVFLPKAQGAWNLHLATANQDLDAFVLFSSIQSIFGSASQGSYASANAFLDGLAQYRRSLGLVAQSFDWGAWAGEGMAARLGAEERLELARVGFGTLEPEAGLRLLSEALARTDAQLVLAAIDVEAIRRAAGDEEVESLLRALVPPASPTSRGSGRFAAFRARFATALPSERERIVLELVRAEVAAALRLAGPDAVPLDRPLKMLGLDSLMALEIPSRLKARIGESLPATLLYDHPTARGVALFIGDLLTHAVSLHSMDPRPTNAERTRSATSNRAPRAASTEVQPRASYIGKDAPADAKARVRSAPDDPGRAGDERTEAREPIAIVAMACRLPGGIDSPEMLWDALNSGVDAIGMPPAHRGWDVDALLDPNPDAPGKTYSLRGGYLSEADLFDAAFFEMSPHEALVTDPQQRLLLEVSWEAMERAGIPADRFKGSRTGVYVGVMDNGYGAGAQPETQERTASLGASAAVASARVSYALGLRGPAVSVDAACSSSLVALHLACQALRAGDCTLALAGGATVMATPRVLIDSSRQRMLAPDGRCKPFADVADGVVWSEGVGVLVLERLSDARANGHPVLAVVRGSALNHDGRGQGITAPSGLAQQELILDALRAAGVDAASVDVVEAHGTGTRIGDTIEAQALLATYGARRPPERPLWVTNAKPALGHTQAAAGVTGVMNAVLALRHAKLTGMPASGPLNHQVEWASSSLEVPSASTSWPPREHPRRAAISAFGVGTNAHVILEAVDEVPDATRENAEDAPDEVALLISGTTEAAMRAQAGRLADCLELHRAALGDMAWTLACHRTHFDTRTVVLASRRTDAVAALRAVALDGAAGKVMRASDLGDARLLAAAAAHAKGETVAWSALLPAGKLVLLPTYPFQQRPFWQTTTSPSASSLLPSPSTHSSADVRSALLTIAPAHRASYLLELVAEEASSVLGLASAHEIGADDRLFSIGFDSLRAAQLRSRLCTRTGVPLPASLLYEHPTSRAIASFLSDALTVGPSATPAPAYEELDL